MAFDICQETTGRARDCKNPARFIVHIREGRELRVCGVHIRWWRRAYPWEEISMAEETKPKEAEKPDGNGNDAEDGAHRDSEGPRENGEKKDEEAD